MRSVIFVSLRTTASADAPSSPMWLLERLQGIGEVGVVGGQAGQRALTRNEHFGAAAHSRSVICVSLRMAASAVAPSALMWLPPRLRARGRIGTVRE